MTTTLINNPATHSKRSILRSGVLAGLASAVATTAVAALAQAADVSFEVDHKAIPLSAFPFWTIVATIAGVVLATVVRRRQQFVTATVCATALSLIPAIIVPDHASTSIVLVVTHLLAAAIIIPTIRRHIPPRV